MLMIRIATDSTHHHKDLAMTDMSEPDKTGKAFWNTSVDQQLKQLSSSVQGLSRKEADQRIKHYGANRLNNKKQTGNWRLFLAQFKNSIILILLFATGLSFYLHDRVDAAIILTIVLISGLLGFWQEKGAANAIEKLLAIVQIKANVRRDGKEAEIAVEDLVPGDIILLKAGDVIPGDCLILESDNLFVDEAILTGESYPAEKMPGVLAADTTLSLRSNALWMGTHVQSGTAIALIVATGQATEFGKLSLRIKLKPPETEFERGIRHFGYLLMEITLVLVILIFAVNVYLNKAVMDSFLFALALAVGLTPQLLPAIISINLAHGAKRMAEQKVIVKQLASIENFGSMNVLCADKTGTLTEGIVQMHGAVDVSGNASDKVALYAYMNSMYETGFANPIDAAIRQYRQFDLNGCEKLDEIPYDFHRKRLSLLVSARGESLLITKGALTSVLDACSEVENADGSRLPIASALEQIQQHYQAFSQQGFRTLGLAYKPVDAQTRIAKTDESGMQFLGFLLFFDPPKTDCAETIKKLRDMGVTLKIITGDNRLVAASVSKQLGLEEHEILTGSEIERMSGSALINKVADVDLFAEVEPNQKERIIVALKKAGFVVGYMGDGINDVSALHAADVGISVDSAADAAKETAEIVLLEKDLAVLIQGVCAGRVTFANTLKYVFMATSSNFGNMFSMAGASLFLPFLPLLPKQILLTNLLTDFPEMTIASDNVEQSMVSQPRRWDIKFIRRFMITFGFVSSLFDYMTFGLLLWLNVSVEQFRTAWFIESVVSAALIVFVVRSSKPFFLSRPGKYLVAATLAIVAVTLALPYTPIAPLIGFHPLQLHLVGLLSCIVALYISTAEIAKHIFYRVVKI
jgi:Mg2+-importing ATPase